MSSVIRNAYFEWLCSYVDGVRSYPGISFRKLLTFLHEVEFEYTIAMDENRASDGETLRYRFSRHATGIEEQYLDGPCTVLEMMIALAIRMEEDIMDDPLMGDRTAQWFWKMIVSLGLNGMTDLYFNRAEAENIIGRFLTRNYSPNGKGGLFTIRNCNIDLREVEIWIQMCWYIDSIS